MRSAARGNATHRLLCEVVIVNEPLNTRHCNPAVSRTHQRCRHCTARAHRRVTRKLTGTRRCHGATSATVGRSIDLTYATHR